MNKLNDFFFHYKIPNFGWFWIWNPANPNFISDFSFPLKYFFCLRAWIIRMALGYVSPFQSNPSFSLLSHKKTSRRPKMDFLFISISGKRQSKMFVKTCVSIQVSFSLVRKMFMHLNTLVENLDGRYFKITFSYSLGGCHKYERLIKT